MYTHTPHITTYLHILTSISLKVMLVYILYKRLWKRDFYLKHIGKFAAWDRCLRYYCM